MPNVLSISLGGVYPKGLTLSGAYQRQLDYARHLDKYTVIAAERRPADGPLPVYTQGNLTIVPTNDANRLDYLRKAIAAGDEQLRRHPYHVITAADPGFSGLVAYQLARRHHLPLDISVMSDILDNPYFLAENPFKHRAGLVLSRRILAAAAGIRVSTRYELEKLKRSYGERAYLARFYVDLAPYRAIDPAAAAAVRERLLAGRAEQKIVLFMGRLAAQKRLDFLLEAAAELQKQRQGTLFVLAGYGPQRAELEALANRLGVADHVLFTGPVPFEEVPLYNAAADAFAITSRHEGTCMVLLEAALAGKPIVATRFAGAIDLLEDTAPELLCPMEGPEHVARALAGLWDDPARAAATGARLREKVLRDYEPEAVSRERVAGWERLCATC